MFFNIAEKKINRKSINEKKNYDDDDGCFLACEDCGKVRV
jgi:hypothetical protein